MLTPRTQSRRKRREHERAERGPPLGMSRVFSPLGTELPARSLAWDDDDLAPPPPRQASQKHQVASEELVSAAEPETSRMEPESPSSLMREAWSTRLPSDMRVRSGLVGTGILIGCTASLASLHALDVNPICAGCAALPLRSPTQLVLTTKAPCHPVRRAATSLSSPRSSSAASSCRLPSPCG